MASNIRHELDPGLFFSADRDIMDIDFDYSIDPGILTIGAMETNEDHFQQKRNLDSPLILQHADERCIPAIECSFGGDSVQGCSYVEDPTSEHPNDVSRIQYVLAQIAKAPNAVSLIENKLAAHTYMTIVIVTQTTDTLNLVVQISQNLDQSRRERLMPLGSTTQPLWELDSARSTTQWTGVDHTSLILDTKPIMATSSLDVLIAQAQRAADVQPQSPVPGGTNRRIAKRKVQAKPKMNKSQPTAMQCAPLSVSAETGMKRVRIDLEDDGTPRVILREGEDPDQPITIAECVARPRDEQLTRPRDGEPAAPRVRINNRRSRPPYLPLEDNMSQEERLRRAIRNQEISELDRQDRRSRNNESARRTRERTKQTITDQAAMIEEQISHIRELQNQIVAQQKEIQRLQVERDKVQDNI